MYMVWIWLLSLHHSFRSPSCRLTSSESEVSGCTGSTWGVTAMAAMGSFTRLFRYFTKRSAAQLAAVTPPSSAPISISGLASSGSSGSSSHSSPRPMLVNDLESACTFGAICCGSPTTAQTPFVAEITPCKRFLSRSVIFCAAELPRCKAISLASTMSRKSCECLACRARLASGNTSKLITRHAPSNESGGARNFSCFDRTAAWHVSIWPFVSRTCSWDTAGKLSASTETSAFLASRLGGTKVGRVPDVLTLPRMPGMVSDPMTLLSL
mmetsp:Transcript_113230/g.158816  ORF Transcript_113230/g.158816 Transcript_113230/m.158816 type:complete len:268 (-) Transcript_113230:257-1060(-)